MFFLFPFWAVSSPFSIPSTAKFSHQRDVVVQVQHFKDRVPRHLLFFFSLLKVKVCLPGLNPKRKCWGDGWPFFPKLGGYLAMLQHGGGNRHTKFLETKKVNKNSKIFFLNSTWNSHLTCVLSINLKTHASYTSSPPISFYNILHIKHLINVIEKEQHVMSVGVKKVAPSRKQLGNRSAGRWIPPKSKTSRFPYLGMEKSVSQKIWWLV